MQRIIPNLWLDDNIQEVVDYYVRTFPHSSIVRTDYYTEAGADIHGHQPGDVLDIIFMIERTKFIAINGGTAFVDAKATSFYYRCNEIDNINALWESLAEEGEVIMPIGEHLFSARYGCLKDKYGITWQLIHSDEKVDHKIAPSMTFAGDLSGKAEEAMRYYVSVFPQSEVGLVSSEGESSSNRASGSVVHGEFTLFNQPFVAKDGSTDSEVKFSEDISLMIECDTQEEVDTYWKALSADASAEVCGWLKDKFGVSWQIVPKVLDEMLQNGTPEQQYNVAEAYMKMKKFDIKALERAYNK